MKQLSLMFAALLVIGLISCNKGNVSTPANQVNLEGFESVSQGAYEKLTKKNEAGTVEVEGYSKNGLKVGTWSEYDKEGNLIGITSFINGKINGPDIKFNNRGQITKMQYFLDGVPEGLYGEYKFGRPLKEVNYKNGKMDGLYQEYYNNGKLQRSINYVDGEIDGSMKYYNEEGEVTLEYMYKNGEKVGDAILKGDK